VRQIDSDKNKIRVFRLLFEGLHQNRLNLISIITCFFDKINFVVKYTIAMPAIGFNTNVRAYFSMCCNELRMSLSGVCFVFKFDVESGPQKCSCNEELIARSLKLVGIPETMQDLFLKGLMMTKSI